MNTTTTTSSSTGFVTLLTILFIGLKLTGYIDWSLAWVLSPLWISAIFAVIVCGVVLFLYSKEFK